MRITQNSNKPLYGTQHSDLSEIKSLAVAFMGILVLNIFSLGHVSNSIPCHISHITCAEARTLAWEKANVLTVIFGWFLIFQTPAGMLVQATLARRGRRSRLCLKTSGLDLLYTTFMWSRHTNVY